jgi:hypothetical protein
VALLGVQIVCDIGECVSEEELLLREIVECVLSTQERVL